jgi:hypothetical protein
MEPTRLRITPTLLAMCVVGLVAGATGLDAAAVLWELVRHPAGALLLELAYRVALLVACSWLLGRLARRLAAPAAT